MLPSHATSTLYYLQLPATSEQNPTLMPHPSSRTLEARRVQPSNEQMMPSVCSCNHGKNSMPAHSPAAAAERAETYSHLLLLPSRYVRPPHLLSGPTSDAPVPCCMAMPAAPVPCYMAMPAAPVPRCMAMPAAPVPCCMAMPAGLPLTPHPHAPLPHLHPVTHLAVRDVCWVAPGPTLVPPPHTHTHRPTPRCT